MHSVDYSCWEGWSIQGKPVMTFLRGQQLVDGDSVGAAHGRHLALGPLSFS
jgi:dihydroorotase-like cyclic amidohydrolase